jgi:hypothetical protein
MNSRLLRVAAVPLIAFGCLAPDSRVETRMNSEAALVGDIASNPLRLKVITLEADWRASTMSTLFGNDIAMQYSRAHTGSDYPIGSTLSFVTWQLREDPRWFGGNIPSQPTSVEVVSVQAAASGRPSYSYRAYQGTPLKEVPTAESAASTRIALLRSKRAAVMP